MSPANQERTMATNNSPEARMKRIETRLSHFMRWFGYDPSRDVTREVVDSHKVTFDGQALYASGPSVTVGDLCQAAFRFNGGGRIPVHMGGSVVAVLVLDRELSEEDFLEELEHEVQ